MAPADFDPYHAWLGVPPHEQPADYYRLLGLPRFESDLGRIARAADERMALVRSYQVGPRGASTQKLLNELSAARVCLLTLASKQQYDAVLAGQMHRPLSPPAAPPRLPPPAPAVVEQAATAIVVPEEGSPLVPSAPRPWWRPIAAMLAAALLFLSAVGGWGWIRSHWPVPATAVEQPQTVEIEPAPPPAPRVIVVLQEASGEVIFSPATAALAGGVELQVVGTEEVLSHWTAPEDCATWQFRLVQPGFFQAELTYAAAEAGELELAIGEQAKTCPLRPSGGLDRFHTDTFTLVVPSGGEHTLLVRPTRSPAGDWLVLKTVRLAPVGAARPGERSDPPSEAAAPARE